MSNERSFNLITQLSLNDDAFKNSIKNVKQNVKDLITGVEGATGNIGEMNKALGALKNISFAGKSTEEIAAINDRIKTLKTSIAELSEAQGSIKPPEFHESKLEEHIKHLATMAGAVEAIKLGYEGFKKIMESNETTAEKLEVVMAEVDGATQSLFRTIANGDFSNLINNMNRAIATSKEYAESMKLIQHEQRGVDLQNAEDNNRIATLRAENAGLLKVHGTEAQRKKNLDEILTLLEKIDVRSTKVATKSIESEKSKLVYHKKTDEDGNVVETGIKGITNENLQKVVKFTDESEENYEAAKKYQELTAKINDELNKQSQVNWGTPGLTTPIKYNEEKINKWREDLKKIVKEKPELLDMTLILSNSTMEDLKKNAAAQINKLEIDKEIKNRSVRTRTQETKLAGLQDAEDEKAQKALEKQKTAYDLLNDAISKIEKNILRELATGGLASPEEQEKLRILKGELKQINSEYDILTNKPMKQMEAKTKVPVVSNLPVIPLSNNLAPLNEFASRAKKVQQDLTDFQKTDAKNLQKFQNEKYSERYQKLREELTEKKITIEQFNKGVKKLDEEQNKDKLSAMSETFALGQSMFEQNTIAYKAMAISKATIDTFMAADTALASAPAPYNFILMAATIAAGISNVGKIAGAFEYGGIVPGSNYSGDNVPIMANSGEMILNGSQQSNLFSMLNKGTGLDGSKEVVFKIHGTQLVGVLNNYNKKLSYTR